MLKKLLLTCSVAAMLTACGSDDDEPEVVEPPVVTPEPEPEPVETSVGVFIDSPIAGITYNASPSGLSGVTNSDGEYEYEEGDTVAFSIGGINLPEVTAKGTVTPLDLGGEGADLANTTVINIIRLLQTLDSDGDPENGITISEEVATALEGITLDVTSEGFEDEVNEKIPSALVGTGLEGTELVSADEAVAHFEGSLQNQIIGSWIYEEDNGALNLLTFFRGNRYIIAHSQADDGDQIAGSAEYGTYSWDPVSSSFSITRVIEESDKSGGLYEASNPSASQDLSLSVTDNGDLTISFVEGGSGTFIPVIDDDNALVGSWFISEVNNALDPLGGAILTFLDDTNYVVSQTYNVESYEGEEPIRATSEWNTYSLDSSGVITVGTPSVELDGDGGLYDKEDPAKTATLSLGNNGDLVLTYSEEDKPSLARVGGYSATLSDFNNDTTTAPLQRAYHRFSSDYAAFYTVGLLSENDENGVYDSAITNYIDINLKADGTGSMFFSDFEETNEILDWWVSSSGVLHIYETAGEQDTANWKFTPVSSKNGDGVLVENLDMDLRYLAQLQEDEASAFKTNDITTSYNVYFDSEVNMAHIATFHFDYSSNLVTATEESAADMVFSGEFTIEGGGKVIKMLFEGESTYQYMVHKGFSEGLYSMCWVDNSDDINYMLNNNIGSCNEYLATSADDAQRAKEMLTPQ